jgi:SAM-dependent methyltransferase
MQDLDWNRAQWNGGYDWKTAGEEWSEAWGGSEAQWFGSLLPRLHRFLPAHRILEIAPGFGRWTKFLLPVCKDYVGIDLSAQCIESSRHTFADVKYAKFHVNDGLSLSVANDSFFDFIFSFDSLVHVEIDVIRSYVKQIIKKLAPNGVAFIHHSNLLAFGGTIGNPHARAHSVSAETVAEIVANEGGRVLIQEVINWGGEYTHDGLTLFSQAAAFKSQRPMLLKNSKFMEEATLVRQFQSPYSFIERSLPRSQSPD